MSAAETGQMSAVETRQMSSVARTDICLVSTHNVQVADRRSGPKSTKMCRNGSRMVARSRESTPRHAAALSKALGPVPRPKIRQKGIKWSVWGLALGSSAFSKQLGLMFNLASHASKNQ